MSHKVAQCNNGYLHDVLDDHRSDDSLMMNLHGSDSSCAHWCWRSLPSTILSEGECSVSLYNYGRNADDADSLNANCHLVIGQAFVDTILVPFLDNGKQCNPENTA